MTRFSIFALCNILLGVVIGQALPATFMQHPLETSSLMVSHPIGSYVAQPLWDDIGRQDFLEPGVVIGYEAIKGLESESILLCLVRSDMGSGAVTAVNPALLRRISLN